MAGRVAIRFGNVIFASAALNSMRAAELESVIPRRAPFHVVEKLGRKCPRRAATVPVSCNRRSAQPRLAVVDWAMMQKLADPRNVNRRSSPLGKARSGKPVEINPRIGRPPTAQSHSLDSN